MSESLRFKFSRIYELCKKLWPNEFDDMFSADKEAFRDWLNHKTSLDEDYEFDRIEATDAWLEQLEKIAKGKSSC